MPLTPESVKYIVIHCSATPPNVKVDRAVIDRWHRERGFLKIGYHFVIKRDGVVEEGRPIDQIGAHVEGFNAQSIGICMAGGCKVGEKGALVPDNNFTDPQWSALRTLVVRMQTLFPNAKVVGHTDLNPNKACPSFNVNEWLATSIER